MKCENEFCVYQENSECILKEISLDIMGQCMDCIYVNIDEQTISNAKQKFRDKYS